MKGRAKVMDHKNGEEILFRKRLAKEKYLKG
jgi:hypothetical protein